MKRMAWCLGLMLVAVRIQAANVVWEHNYEEALAKARKDKKLLMVDVYTDWCGWCKKLDRDVYTAKTVQEKLTKDFVALKINPEKSSKNAQLAKEFGTHGFPHIVFLGADGKKVREIGGYLPAEDFAKVLESVVSKSAR